MIRNKNIFITGGGFIGRNLAVRLSEKNSVTVLTRKREDIKSSNMLVVEGDILKPETFAFALEKCDIVFHCAAYISFEERGFKDAYRINVDGTRHILEACHKKGVKKVVYLSACSVLGYVKDKNKVLNESSDPEIPKSNAYAYTKKQAELIVREYVGKGLNASIANIATVYGPGDRKMNSGSIIKAIYENKVGFSPPGGTSYVSVTDLVNGLMLLAEKGKAGERYIFCSENLTFSELFNRIAEAIGRKKIVHKLPRWTYLPIIAAAYIKSKLPTANKKSIDLITPQIIKEAFYYKYYDSGKARRELGWQPKELLEKAVRAALDYYIREGLVNERR
ncbi:MAG: NAD-dependent epimerase/dehydratase family protein [Candidatus Omnitrophota bacterium]